MALHHSFAGKKVLITGGGRGIGRQLVQRFYDDNAIVFTIDKDAAAMAEVKKSLPKVTAEVVDISDWEATKKVVESFGAIDHLVNNAGIIILQHFLDVTKEADELQYKVHLAGTINISQVAAGQGGSIVNVGSIGARVGSEIGTTAYSALKAGIENLTKTMSIDLAPHSIRVNAISPGTVDTGILETSGAGKEVLDFLAKQEKRCAIKRFIKTDEIADLVMFLLSPLSTMICGEAVLIDAGCLTS